MPKTTKLAITEDVEITLRTYAAKGAAKGNAVLAHGAGADQSHPFMIAFSEGLAERGIETTTFNFGYTERKKKSPDPNDTLEACYRKVFEQVKKPVVLGGKSMGGRIASQIVAGGVAAKGLFFLGYPLHPPGQAKKLRIAHWPKITVPCLFVQGSRDPFGSPEELAKYTDKLGGAFDVHPVAGGDHSLGVTKKALAEQGKTQEQILDDAMNAVADFVAARCKK
ncbi:MAG TPA: alpha/beta family hydrolase [Polyangiaceae bacterium]